MHVSGREMDADGAIGEASTGACEEVAKRIGKNMYVKQTGGREARKAWGRVRLWNETYDGEAETCHRRDPSGHTHGPAHALRKRPCRLHSSPTIGMEAQSGVKLERVQRTLIASEMRLGSAANGDQSRCCANATG
jgi:hypothetical protein